MDWNALVREQGPAVFRIAFRILGNTADAEEVMQDAFCEAWQVQKSREVANWPGLLRKMAVLRAIDKLRRRRPTVPLAESNLLHQRGSPPDVAMARELADVVLRRSDQCVSRQTSGVGQPRTENGA